jgi:hypothetical protein
MSTLFLMAAQKVGARCTSVARCAALMLVIYLAVDTLQASARESEHLRAPSHNTYSTDIGQLTRPGPAPPRPAPPRPPADLPVPERGHALA